jgi:hypothetical protein
VNTLILQTALIRAQQRGGLQKSAWNMPGAEGLRGAWDVARMGGRAIGDVYSEVIPGVLGSGMVEHRPEGYAGGKSVGLRGQRLVQPGEQTVAEPMTQEAFKAPAPPIGQVNPALGSVNWMTNPVQRAVQEARKAYGNPGDDILKRVEAKVKPWLIGGAAALGGFGLLGAWQQSQQTAAMQQMAQQGGMNPQAWMAGYRQQQQQQPWAMSATRTPQEAV